MLGDAGFDVTLSFGDGYENLSIPFDAIEGLVCQDEGFALQLPSLEDTDEDAEDEEAPATVETFEEEAVEETDDKGGDNVVTLDAFRRK